MVDGTKDFNITIVFDRYKRYTDCNLENDGGWNDLITGRTLNTSVYDWLTGATPNYTDSEVLNREWNIKGKVIKGRQLGRKIGFPTCNLQLNDYIVPCNGVYAVKVKGSNFNKKGIANVGFRPTFNGKKLLLETNIFGIDKNLYNKEIDISFKKFIRREKKFKNLEHLKKQIKIDIKKAK